MFDLTGKVAVVTGCSEGIGAATVHRFAKAGAVVISADLKSASASSGQGIFHKTVDVSDEEAVAQLIKGVVGDHGRIDIMVNNAGIAGATDFIEQCNPDDVRKTMSVNTFGVLHGVKHAALAMSSGGSIINVASMAAISGAPGYTAYALSKWPVIGLTQIAAIELGARQIRVNAVCPGVVNTAMTNNSPMAEFEKRIITATTPLERVCEPEEIAAAIHFLASDDCGYITGQALHICGGSSAGLALGIPQVIAAAMQG
jgi:3alpha(or 20beta)-hydroxysteroid dehydrogenase